MTAANTTVLREIHREKREKLSRTLQHNNAACLCERVSQLKVFKQAQNVAAYIAIRGEIDVAEIIKRGTVEAKQFYLPVLRGKSMYFLPWSPGERLEKKRFGLLEPALPLSQKIEIQALDLVLAPLVVFDQQCNRIGQGGGFYDRTFAHKLSAPQSSPMLLGVAHDSQREPQLLPERWDVPLDLVATNSSIYSKSIDH